MKNGFNETTFGDNQGRPNNLDAKAEYHTSRPAEDRRTFNNPPPGGASGYNNPPDDSPPSVSAAINNTQTNVKRIVLRGDQNYERQLRTCQDFNKGLSTFIQNNNNAIQEMHRDITEAIARNALGDFQVEMQQSFMLFQRDVNESIALLNFQKGKFGVHMETLKFLMAEFKIPIPTDEGVKGGLSDTTNQILEDNK